LRTHRGLLRLRFAIERRAAQYRYMRQIARGGAVIAVVLGILAACALAPERGLAERCAGLMRQAYPEADIDITKRVAAARSLTTVLATVEGERRHLPPNAAIARHLAVECTFDNDVLNRLSLDRGAAVSGTFALAAPARCRSYSGPDDGRRKQEGGDGSRPG
jgi:hypothetical protein